MVHLAHAINIFNKGFSHSKAGLRSEVGCTTDARIVTTQYVRQQICQDCSRGEKVFRESTAYGLQLEWNGQ